MPKAGRQGLVWEVLWVGALAVVAGGCMEAPRQTAAAERTARPLMIPERGASITIQFDTDAAGVPIPRGTVLAEQYADWGVHFHGSFIIGDHATDFPAFEANQGNMLCTPESATDPANPGGCAGGPPLGTPLVVDLDFDAGQAIVGAFPQAGVIHLSSPPAGLPKFGRITLEGFDGSGVLESSYVATSVGVPACGQPACVLDFIAMPVAPGIPTSPLPSIPAPGYDFRRLVVTESGLRAIQGLSITRRAGFLARCTSRVSCAEPGQALAPSVSVSAGTEDPDGNPITYSQTPAGPFPVGTTTVVTMTASNGITTSSCEGSIEARDCTPPTLTCPPPTTVECVGGCGALTLPMASAIDDLPGSVQIEGGSGGTCVSPSTFQIQFRATDLAGNTATCTTPVAAVDTQPPVVNFIGDPTSLGIEAAFSPPDDQLKTVSLRDCGVNIVDACSGGLPIEGSARITCVSSDEAPTPHPRDCSDSSHGHGHGHGQPPAPPDIVLVDETTVQLRASRDNDGNGRVYTITFEAFDSAGNVSAPQQCKVLVARHAGRTAIDSGPHETVCRD